MAEDANSVTSSVLGELVPIEAEVKRIKSNYGSTQSASFNKALMEANNSGIAGVVRGLPNHCKGEHGQFAAEALNTQVLDVYPKVVFWTSFMASRQGQAQQEVTQAILWYVLKASAMTGL